MPNLKEVRIRIASVSSTMQITSAMKMVSASKLRKVQNLILKLRPYSAKLSEIIENICRENFEVDTPFTESRPQNHVLLVIVASNKGLCGAFNTNIIKETNARIAAYREKDKYCKISLLCIGKRLSDFFEKSDYTIAGVRNEIFDHLTFEASSKIAQEIMDGFSSKKYDTVEFIYNKFKNAATQIISVEQFLPIVNETSGESSSQNDYIFEPSKEEIIESVLPLALKTQFYKVLLDSFASEQGARMISMQKATDNATELLKDLKLSYNKARQAAITNEIIEIVSAANALQG